MSLLLVSLNDTKTPLDVLEKLSLSPVEQGRLLSSLATNLNLNEVVVLSTCQRTEIYASIERFHDAVDEIRHTLSKVLNVDVTDIDEYATIEFDRGVTKHLFEIAAGMASVVPGEFEVLGQLREALNAANEEAAAGTTLNDLFRRALSAGRAVRDETNIAKGSVSFSQVAVELMRETFDDVSGMNVVVLGAGQLASNVATALTTQMPELASIHILNRTVENAELVKQRVSAANVHAHGLNDLNGLLESADVLIAAVSATMPLMTLADIDGRTRDLLIVDFGMPRAVDHEVATAPGVTLVDMASLRKRVDAVMVNRQAAFSDARSLLERSVDDYYEDRRSRQAASVVSELRRALEEQRQVELDRRASQIEALSPENRELIDAITSGVIAKIAHRPTMVLKESAGSEKGERLSEAVRQLFDLNTESSE